MNAKQRVRRSDAALRFVGGRWWCLQGLVAILFMTSESLAADSPTSSEVWRERIAACVASLDVDRLYGMAVPIGQDWKERDPEIYGLLICQLGADLTSLDLPPGTTRQYQLAESVAWDALAVRERLSVETESRLVRILGANTEPLVDERITPEWIAARDRKIDAWLHIWLRIEVGIDPAWDASDVPGVVPLSDGDELPRNPKELAAIRAARDAQQRYREQRTLRDLQNRFSPVAEKMLKSLVSVPPFQNSTVDLRLQAEAKGSTLERLRKILWE